MLGLYDDSDWSDCSCIFEKAFNFLLIFQTLIAYRGPHVLLVFECFIASDLKSYKDALSHEDNLPSITMAMAEAKKTTMVALVTTLPHAEKHVSMIFWTN